MSTLERSLIRAIGRGNVKTVTTLIQEGADVNAIVDIYAITPMMVGRREVIKKRVRKKNFTPRMSDSQPPPTNDIISMFNNLVNYLKSKTVDDETTRKDVAHVISTSEHLMTYFSTLKKSEEEEKKEETKLIEGIMTPLVEVIKDNALQEIHIGFNVVDREVGRTMYFKMTPQTPFQKVFSSFVKRVLYANGGDSVDVEVKTSFFIFVFHFQLTNTKHIYIETSYCLREED